MPLRLQLQGGRVQLTPLEEAWLHVLGVGSKGPAKAITLDLRSVSDTQGDERERWRESLAKEMASLTGNHTFDVIKTTDVPSGTNVAPAKCVLTLKPSLGAPEGEPRAKRKSRITVCGRFVLQAHESSTTNLDSGVMRLCIAIAIQRLWTMSSVDVSTAFLNASLPSHRGVYVRPPAICIRFGLCASDEFGFSGEHCMACARARHSGRSRGTRSSSG